MRVTGRVWRRWMIAAVVPLVVQCGAAGSEADRARLLAGVDGIPKFGAPGPVAIFGERAFPVIVGGAEGRPRMALCAAGELGKGRVLVFGHTDYVDGKAEDAGHRRLLLNAIAWCAADRKPRVGVRSSAMEAFLSGEGIEARRIEGRVLTREALRGIDVLIVRAQGMTDGDEALAVGAFVSAGGGLIAAATGWAFEQTSGGKELVEDLAINRVLAPAGLGFTAETLPHASDRFSAEGTPAPLLNADAGLKALGNPKGPGLSETDLAQAVSSIDLAVSVQPAGGSALLGRVSSALQGMRAAVPSKDKPLGATHAAERARLALEARLCVMSAAFAAKAHPAAAEFPGAVPASACRVKRDVQIDPGRRGWHSTGLYAAPGETITVTVPESVADASSWARIGCHTDRLYDLDSWRRAPEVARRVQISGPVTRVANAFGGLVYIELPEKGGPDAPFTATVDGAVPAPLFVLGRDDDGRWDSDIKRRPAPWAEFACDRVVLTCPTDVARRVTNPTELMRFWANVLDAQAELAGVPAERRRPERIVADVQISAGYMHSGYPIMVPMNEAEKMVTRSEERAPGWGFYHELGHNHQKPVWTFDGTVEVTCNLFSLWSFHKALGEPDPTVGHEAMAPERRDGRLKKHLTAGAPFAAWKKEPFLALTLYWQLIDGFGWDALKRVIASYEGGEFGPPPKSDEEKRDQWMVRYSKIVGKDLGPFFDRWGVPVSAAAKASVAGLGPWMPQGM